MKLGLKEYLLELIVDADLVRQLAVLHDYSDKTCYFSLSDLLNDDPSTILPTIYVLN